MSRHETASQIAALLKDSNDFNDVSASVEVKAVMKRARIINKYGSQIKQIKDGRYHIRYEGKQIFKKTYDLVIEEILKMQNQEGVRTLESISEQFFEYRYTNCASGTYAKDKNNYEKFIKGTPLATKDITKVALNDGVEWANHCLEVKRDMKEKYFKNVRGTLNQMFQYAIDNQWLAKNLLEKISIHRDHLAPKTVHKDNELIFEDWERKKVCELAYKDAIQTKSSLPLAIPFLFSTGIRDGELCALKWKDIEKGGIHVQAEMVEKRDENNKFSGYKYVDHAKTPAGNRIIELNKEVKKILYLIKKSNLENGYPINPDDFIFLREYKNNVCECTTRCFDTRIRKYCRKAGMDIAKSQHDIRRTFATNLFYARMNEKDIQALMGHSSLEETMSYIKKKGTNASIISLLDSISSDKDIQNVI
ncbi:MAG: site-specific integrase [Butyrivibrio sp.]|nr:site-specific integrase [Butyrivibrio sp.]